MEHSGEGRLTATSRPEPFCKMRRSASYTREKAKGLKTWVEKIMRITHPNLRPGGLPGGAGRGGAPPWGGALPGSGGPAGGAGLHRFSAGGSRRDVSPQGGLQDPGAAAAGVPRPRACPEGR